MLITSGDLPSLDDEDVERTFAYGPETVLCSVSLEGHLYQGWPEALSSEPSDTPDGNPSLLHVRN